MLHTKFQGYQSIGSGEEDFYSFYHIWAWWPCWLCDPTHLYKFSFLFSLKLSYEFWSKNDLDFDTHSTSLTHLAERLNQLCDLRLQ